MQRNNLFRVIAAAGIGLIAGMAAQFGAAGGLSAGSGGWQRPSRPGQRHSVRQHARKAAAKRRRTAARRAPRA